MRDSSLPGDLRGLDIVERVGLQVVVPDGHGEHGREDDLPPGGWCSAKISVDGLSALAVLR